MLLKPVRTDKGKSGLFFEEFEKPCFFSVFKSFLFSNQFDLVTIETLLSLEKQIQAIRWDNFR